MIKRTLESGARIDAIGMQYHLFFKREEEYASTRRLLDPEKIKASLGNMFIGENYYYGGLIRFDLSPKPAYLKLMELINKKWHTETAVTTDKNGVCSFRGFYGEYLLEIRSGSKCITKQVNVSKNSDNKINVVL